MPESKHRRKNRTRPRPRHVEPPQRRPTPSPTWVPATAVTLLVVGVVVIIVGYLDPVQEATRNLPALQSNWPLVGGFVLLTVGFGFLTRWR
jgi:hypothetical protein